MSTPANKPLGHKSYGSIPHLPGSRTGPRDRTCHEGQYRICCEKPRDKNDLIIVQEKLDGSNCAVANIDGTLVALGRAGYPAQSSKYEMHQLFAGWVRQREMNFRALLEPGERVCGEWLIQAHGTVYDSISPDHLFRPFDLIQGQMGRLTSDEVRERCLGVDLEPPALLHAGDSCSIEDALWLLEASPEALHPREGLREGCVWRVERNGKVDFLAKYVRPEKVDGKYLDGPPVWMNR